MSDRFPDDAVLPPVAAKPCNECPWRRDSAPGHLGPNSAEEWVEMAHGEVAIACHKTIVVEPGETTGDWAHPKMRQCAGVAIFRRNVFKEPRNEQIVTLPRDTETIFGWNDEFIAHHRGES